MDTTFFFFSYYVVQVETRTRHLRITQQAHVMKYSLDLLKIIFISEFVQADRVYAGEQIWPVQPYTWYEHFRQF